MKKTRVVIVGGGPGGYEAALVAARQDAEVTIIEQRGLGGSAVLTDVVPSKTLIATAEWMTIVNRSEELGIPVGVHEVDLGVINRRVQALAAEQSNNIRQRLIEFGVKIIAGRGRLTSPHTVEVQTQGSGEIQSLEADVILIATGATPRELPSAQPDGQRILTWTQLYHLDEMPEHLIVVGSGVTGAEFAGAYRNLGARVTLVSSRDRVLPGEDPDAAQLIDDVFRDSGMNLLARSRADSVTRTETGVAVQLATGEVIEGSHCLMAVGSIPNTSDMGLEDLGMRLHDSGHIKVDRVSRTSVPGVYAAGDCTGLLALASVAATQGRIAMSHALGDEVHPLDLSTVAANVFTAPEIATVGLSQQKLEARNMSFVTEKIPLENNPRYKMIGSSYGGFVKIFANTSSRTVLGAVVVGPRASEHIYPLTIAVQNRLTVDDVARAFTIYPSLSGSISEVSRMLHRGVEDFD